MLSNIGYRLTAFADYSNLSYSQDNLFKMFRAFEGTKLTPSVVQELSLMGGAVGQRMNFSAEDKFFIEMPSHRIDILAGAGKMEGFSAQDKASVVSKLLQAMSKIYTAFGEHIQDANRLAWGTTFVYFDLAQDARTAFKDRFLRPVAFYKDISTDEFVARYAGREVVTLQGRSETLNVITTIEPYCDDKVDGYSLTFDINTLRENTKNRFGPDAFEDFLRAAGEVQARVEEGFLNGYS